MTTTNGIREGGDESAIAESEKKYRDLFDSIDEGLCIIEMLFDDAGRPVDYRFLEVNPAFHRHTGLSDAGGKTVRQLIPDHEQYWFDIYGNVATTGEPARFEQRGEGMHRWFDVYAFRVGAPEQRHVAVLFTDITARKQQEGALARLASIVDSSDDAIISKDPGGIVTTWNKAAERMFGYSEDEAIGRWIASLIIPPDRQYEEDDILARLAAGETVDHFETVRKRKDDSLLDVSVTISPLRNREGQVVGASKIARNISGRIRAEKVLLASEARSRQILDSAIDYAIIAMDTEGRITLWNEGAHRVLGWAPEEILGQSIATIFTPEDVAAGRIAHEMQRARVRERGSDERWHLRKGGDTFRASGEMMPLLDDVGAVVGFVKVLRDRTEHWLANKHRELLVQELNHRVKNTLATVQALARQTFRGPEMQQAIVTFEARLLAMSTAHDLLTRENWQGAGIREIVGNAITAWVGATDSRIAAEGPQLRLRPSAALALAMALHELATNASKYGALSNKTGTIAIDWSVSGDPPARFRLEWREQGGPPVQPPSRRGFGSRLVEYALAQDLGGTVDLSFGEGGVGCVIDAPVEEIREEDAVS